MPFLSVFRATKEFFLSNWFGRMERLRFTIVYSLGAQIIIIIIIIIASRIRYPFDTHADDSLKMTRVALGPIHLQEKFSKIIIRFLFFRIFQFSKNEFSIISCKSCPHLLGLLQFLNFFSQIGLRSRKESKCYRISSEWRNSTDPNWKEDQSVRGSFGCWNQSEESVFRLMPRQKGSKRKGVSRIRHKLDAIDFSSNFRILMFYVQFPSSGSSSTPSFFLSVGPFHVSHSDSGKRRPRTPFVPLRSETRGEKTRHSLQFGVQFEFVPHYINIIRRRRRINLLPAAYLSRSSTQNRILCCMSLLTDTTEEQERGGGGKDHLPDHSTLSLP